MCPSFCLDLEFSVSPVFRVCVRRVEVVIVEVVEEREVIVNLVSNFSSVNLSYL